MKRAVRIGERIRIGAGAPLALIAGPCVIESEKVTIGIARALARLARSKRIPLIFKASFDKANRTSRASFRGPGPVEGLRILARVRRETGLPVLTDIHEPAHAAAAGQVADVLQIPALLSRQTDLIEAAAETGRAVNIKKGQFMSPDDLGYAVAKARSRGNSNILVTERGTTFGYRNLVVDMRSFVTLKSLPAAVVFDATHSVQLPGGRGSSSDGQRELVPVLARAACAAGVDALFVETHPSPARALSDGPNSWPLGRLGTLWDQAVRAAKAAPR